MSPPTWDAVYFLRAGAGAQEVRYGVFGYTGSGTSLGYNINPAGLKSVSRHYGIGDSSLTSFFQSDNRLAAGTVRRLTQILVLHPIGMSLRIQVYQVLPCSISLYSCGIVRACLLVRALWSRLPSHRNHLHDHRFRPGYSSHSRRLGHRHGTLRHCTQPNPQQWHPRRVWQRTMDHARCPGRLAARILRRCVWNLWQLPKASCKLLLDDMDIVIYSHVLDDSS